MDKSDNTKICIDQSNDVMHNDPYFYMPEDIWPDDVRVDELVPHHLWHRESDWKPVKAVNEKNYEIVKNAIEHYNKWNVSAVETRSPIYNDDFWLDYIGDSLISNAISTRDYVFDADNVGSVKLASLLKQYDVVFQETIGGRVCHPFVVFDIEYRNRYAATYRMDEYAENILQCLKDEIDDIVQKRAEDTIGSGVNVLRKPTEDNEHLDILKRKYEKTKLQLIKDGHAIYSVRNREPEYRMEIRWIEYTLDKNILHKSCY